MRVAIVHDFLMQMGGGEKVVEVLHDMFPDAPVYTSAYDPEAMPARYRDWDIRTTFLQRLWMKRHTHRAALLLYPLAFETLSFNEFDLVISSSSAFAKGIITQPHTTHVSYTHAPMRYAWTTRKYVENEKLSVVMKHLLLPTTHYLRAWDYISSARVDQFVANSTAVSGRIKKYYRRDSEIIFPPVDTLRFRIADRVADYYILVSRFIPYKRIDLAIEAFNRLKKPLKIVGTGRQMNELKAKARSNIEFLGHVSDADLPALLAGARAFIMPGEEDFGIAPVEANACGVPVIAYKAGGALDSQRDRETGILFDEQNSDSLCDAVCEFEMTDFDRHAIRSNALRFDTRHFKTAISDVITRSLKHSGSIATVVSERRQAVHF